MNLDLSSISSKIQPAIDWTKRYATFMFLITMLGIIGFIVMRINYFNGLEPSEDAVMEQLQKAPRPRIDAAALEKIEQLENQNIEVQSLFDNARNNPFNE